MLQQERKQSMPNTQRLMLVYADRLLANSETFILNQSEALQTFEPLYVGSRRVEDGLPLDPQKVYVANGRGHISKLSQYTRLLFTGSTGSATLARSLAPLQPVFIQAHYGPGGANALPLKRKLGIPLFVYFHGIDATMTDHFARQSLYTRNYLRHREALKAEADLFITTSDFIGSRLKDQGFPPERIVTHYIGVKMPDADVPPLPLAEREPMVLFVARLVEKKGGAHLINAMQAVQDQMPEARLVVIGDGPMRTQWEAQAARKLRNYRFVGWQNPDQVRDWMRQARVFSVPSVTASNGDAEGFGMVFAEAQIVGTPVASFVHGGIPEAVLHGETGLLAPEGDTDELARHLLRLLQDDDLWSRFSQAGAERVRREFNLSTQTQTLEALYHSQLATLSPL